MTQILYEDTIPFGEEYFSSLGSAAAYQWQNIQPSDLGGISLLAVRSTTEVTSALLSQADTLEMVATATAGTNHMEVSALEQKRIPWASAAGCNAAAVAEYVVSVLFHAHISLGMDLSRLTVGIVGAGHVGTTLSHVLQALNVSYKLCDPPLKKAGDERHFVDMEDILQCDVISLHVPFVEKGEYTTDNLIDARALEALNEHQLLINACRGEVVDEQALLAKLAQPNAPRVVMDVFWHEPEINIGLLPHVWLMTPHIAGHSVEGKLRGTQRVYEQFCEQLGKTPSLTMDDFLEPVPAIEFTPRDPSGEALDWHELAQLFSRVYDITYDDRTFRDGIESPGFAEMRKRYRVRRECSAYVIRLSGVVSEGIIRQLTGLGFILEML